MSPRFLYGTIFVLVGIVIGQWTMPQGNASVVTTPTGNVVAADGTYALTMDGGLWDLRMNSGGHEWIRVTNVPVPVEQVQFFHGYLLTDTNGDLWIYNPTTGWENVGQPPLAPVSTAPSTLGGVKAKYR